MNYKTKLLSCLAPLAATAGLAALDLTTPFEALPAETVAAFRFDNSPEMLAEYVEKTRMGQLLFSEEKIVEYKAFIAELIDSKEEGAAFLQRLTNIGLEMEDLYEMASSHFGAAVVQQEVPGHLSMPTILVWAEMGAGVAERAFGAVLEATADKEGIERTDLELPGGSGARIRTLADHSSFLVGQLEHRIFFALGNVREVIEDMAMAKVFEDAELEALGRFMAAQLGGGGEFLTSFYSDPWVGGIRPDFYARLELLGEVASLLDFLPAQSVQLANALELERFTKVGVWSGLVGMEERSVAFLGVPEPRSGIAQLLENEFFEFRPPAWVPSSANTYSAASFDMSKLYDFALDTAKKFIPPEVVEQQLAKGNAQLQTALQADLPTLLSAFGNRLHVVEYPIEIVTVDGADGTSMEIPRKSQAMVMDYSRPEILEAGLALLAGMRQGSSFELIDEQGFRGIRVEDPRQGVVTIAHGLGKLVFTVGTQDTSSRVFSTLANLPQGEEALAGSLEFQEFVRGGNVKPGMLFSYSRGEDVLKNLVPVLKSLGGTLRASSGGESGEFVEKAMELIPSEEELEGLLGITFSRVYYNEAGIILEGSNQYK